MAHVMVERHVKGNIVCTTSSSGRPWCSKVDVLHNFEARDGRTSTFNEHVAGGARDKGASHQMDWQRQ